jgi:hypothetical protein
LGSTGGLQYRGNVFDGGSKSSKPLAREIVVILAMPRRPTAFEVSFPGEAGPETEPASRSGDSETDIQKSKRKGGVLPDARVSNQTPGSV